MSKGTLFDKVWDMHTIGRLEDGRMHLYVGRHLVHEVTSPQAFEMLREKNITELRRPDLTFAVSDHVIPTTDLSRPYADPEAEEMVSVLEQNVKEFGIEYFGPGSGKNGVCHVTFPDEGIIWPGILAVCGDSHTSTYGALGAVAFGIGTTQVSHVGATQTIAFDKKQKVRKINFNGELALGVTPKDMVMHMIAELGIEAGIGFAYELGGNAIENMSMEGRFTMCNMGVEANAKSCYINPDETTFKYLKGKSKAPSRDWDNAVELWKTFTSEPDAEYDDVVNFDVSKIQPMISWGTDVDQAINLTGFTPSLDKFENEKARDGVKNAYNYMGLEVGQELYGTPVDVVFIGSCTNGRLEDLAAVAEILKGRTVSVRTIIVPGSEKVKRQAELAGYADIFENAGAEWRNPGCSMCLAMNPDKLGEYERSVSTSNRNFEGRQGRKGRTHLVSPYTAAATAVEGRIADPRDYLGGGRK